MTARGCIVMSASPIQMSSPAAHKYALRSSPGVCRATQALRVSAEYASIADAEDLGGLHCLEPKRRERSSALRGCAAPPSLAKFNR